MTHVDVYLEHVRSQHGTHLGRTSEGDMHVNGLFTKRPPGSTLEEIAKTTAEHEAKLKAEEEAKARGKAKTEEEKEKERKKEEEKREKEEDFHLCTKYIMGLLKALWADPKIWKRVKENTSASEISSYIKAEYRLIFPRTPVKIWKSLVTDDSARLHLFDTIALQRWRLLQPNAEFGKPSLLKELSQKRLFAVIDQYLSRSGLDQKSLLASQDFSPAALEAIKDFAQRLFKDAEWCLKNPNQIPPILARHNIGAPKTRRYVETIECLVKIICENPRASDGEIAIMHTGKPDDTARKAAAVAKQLARYREGKRVKFHPKK